MKLCVLLIQFLMKLDASLKKKKIKIELFLFKSEKEKRLRLKKKLMEVGQVFGNPEKCLGLRKVFKLFKGFKVSNVVIDELKGRKSFLIS